MIYLLFVGYYAIKKYIAHESNKAFFKIYNIKG